MHRQGNLSSDLRTVIQGSCMMLTKGLNVCNAPEATVSSSTDAKTWLDDERLQKDTLQI